MKKTVRLRKRPKVVLYVPDDLLPAAEALASFWWDGKTDEAHEGCPPYESLRPYPFQPGAAIVSFMPVDLDEVVRHAQEGGT